MLHKVKFSLLINNYFNKKTNKLIISIDQTLCHFPGVISAFLHVHPFGAGVDYVWSYLQKIEPTLRPSEVEGLLSRFPTVFRQELFGIGANMERRWQFAGFSAEDRIP